MAWTKVEDTFRNHWKPKRLATELGIRRAEARGLVTALWSWASGQAPDGDLSQLDEIEIEDAADWEGKPGEFVRAASLPRIQVLDKTKHGYIIHEFLERAESHKAATRKAKEREKKRKAKDTEEAMSRDSHATVTTSSENCHGGEEKRGEEKRENRDLEPPPAESHAPILRPIDTESAARPTKLVEPLVLAEWDTLRRLYSLPGPENYDLAHHRAAGTLYASYPKRWAEVLRKFATDAFYENVGYSLKWLAGNSAQVDGRKAPTAKVNPAEKRQVIPTKQEAEAQRKRNGVDEAAPAGQEQALAAIRAVVAKLER